MVIWTGNQRVTWSGVSLRFVRLFCPSLCSVQNVAETSRIPWVLLTHMKSAEELVRPILLGVILKTAQPGVRHSLGTKAPSHTTQRYHQARNVIMNTRVSKTRQLRSHSLDTEMELVFHTATPRLRKQKEIPTRRCQLQPSSNDTYETNNTGVQLCPILTHRNSKPFSLQARTPLPPPSGSGRECPSGSASAQQ